MLSKVIDLEDMDNDLIPDGSTIAIGGVHSHNVPMSLVRQLIRLGSKNLTLIGSISAGLPIDLLVGSGQVEKVIAPYVGFEMWGLSPQFRKAAENQSIQAPDVCEAFPIYSLRAGGNGMPFHPFPEGIHYYSDIHKDNPLYKKVVDPFTGTEVLAVKGIQPDLSLIHVQEATIDGNCVHYGSVVTDRLMAAASKKVIVSTEKLIDDNKLMDPNRTSIPSFYVDYLVELPRGAFPTSSHGCYSYDESEIHRYLKACRDDTSYLKYLEEVRKPEKEYLRNHSSSDKILTTKPATSSYSKAELISVVFARDIKENEVGICGAVSEIPMAAMQLAERLHASGMKWLAGGSGYVNPRGNLVMSSTDYKMSEGAEAKLSMDEVIAVEMNNLDFFFAGGIQIDARGNTNLAGIYKNGKIKLRGPGSVGLAFLPRAQRVYLYTPSHSKRTLVERVSYVSGPGHPDGGNPYGGGPSLLVTDLCVFQWDVKQQKWKLQSLHPEVSLETVNAETGFKFLFDEVIPITTPPTEEELTILREIDKFGFLRRETG